MKIIAKTDDGFIISANRQEVKEILSSVNGKEPDKIDIGQKIPAIDYSSSIKKVKSLHTNYSFNKVRCGIVDLVESFDKLNKAVSEASEVDI